MPKHDRFLARRKCVAYCYSIEFQKRGLPHGHLVVWLAEADQPTTHDMMDNIVSARRPKDDDPELQKLVDEFMTHEPCGAAHSNRPCIREDICK